VLRVDRVSQTVDVAKALLFFMCTGQVIGAVRDVEGGVNLGQYYHPRQNDDWL